MGWKKGELEVNVDPCRLFVEGKVDIFVIGKQDQAIFRLLDDCWYGFNVVGDGQTILTDTPTKLSDYDSSEQSTQIGEIPLNGDTLSHH